MLRSIHVCDKCGTTPPAIEVMDGLCTCGGYFKVRDDVWAYAHDWAAVMLCEALNPRPDTRPFEPGHNWQSGYTGST